MNPGSKITWPQYVAEMIIYLRTQILKDYKDIQRGPKWYASIPKPVRDLNQQASVVCNYFEHPTKEPLVAAAFRNYFRKVRPLKMGQYRKVRFTTKGGKQVSNITQDEKDIVTGITAELDRLTKQRNAFVSVAPKPKSEDPIKFKTTQKAPAKGAGLASIMALEEQLKKNNKSADHS
jgi:hypothetical protein